AQLDRNQYDQDIVMHIGDKEYPMRAYLADTTDKGAYYLELRNSSGLKEDLEKSNNVSLENLVAPFNPQIVKDYDDNVVEGAKLIDLDYHTKKRMFGSKNEEGEMAKRFPELFSREVMNAYYNDTEGFELTDYFYPIAMQSRWFKLIKPIASHYMYGYEGHWYSKKEAVEYANKEGKKYSVAEYMS
ncbi:MAG TPA: hypothetical protein VLB82_14900, partial [Thermodesulfobacteriota bacterium]|nr:hypothetical protein [Thermodesulfobacteriota bacterium]